MEHKNHMRRRGHVPHLRKIEPVCCADCGAEYQNSGVTQRGHFLFCQARICDRCGYEFDFVLRPTGELVDDQLSDNEPIFTRLRRLCSQCVELEAAA